MIRRLVFIGVTGDPSVSNFFACIGLSHVTPVIFAVHKRPFLSTGVLPRFLFSNIHGII